MSNDKNKGGRPAKLTLDDKIAILTRLAVQLGGQASQVLQSRGINKRLAECAISMGFTTAKPYDFYNDNAFKMHLLEYASRLPAPVDPQKSSALGVAYEPLAIGKIILLPLDKQRELLEEREIYVQHLYDIAASSVERYDSVIKENQNLKEEIKKALEDCEAEKRRRKEDRKRYVKDMEELKYFRDRYFLETDSTAVNFNSDESHLSAFKPFSAAVSESTINPSDKEATMSSGKLIELFKNEKEE